MRLECAKWAGYNAIATRRLVGSIMDCCNGTITFATGAHNTIVVDSVSTNATSCSQYPGDNCRTSCSDTSSVNCPVAICRCRSIQKIPNIELHSLVSSARGQCELPRGSREISHREIKAQRECSFRRRKPMEASASISREIRLIIAGVAATVRMQ